MIGAGRMLAWTAALYGAALGVPAALGLMLAAGQPDADAAALRRIIEGRAALLAFAALLLLLACAGIVRWILYGHAAAARALAEKVRLIRGANPELRLAGESGELAAVAAAVNELADAYLDALREGEARAAEARARLEEERNRLAALMSELSQGVLVCNAVGTILLYNEQARSLFVAPEAGSQHPLVGLGRSLFALIDRGQIAHALQRIERSLARGERLPRARFIAVAPAGRLVKAQVAPYLDSEGRVAGMVLALEDVTELLDREAQRRSLLQTFASRIRAPAASIRAAAENLAAYPEIDAQRRTQFIDIVAAESRALASTINDALREYADALKAALTLEDLRAADLLEFARLRIESVLGISAQVAEPGDEVWIKADSYALVQAMLHLVTRLREAQGVRSVELRARRAERFAEIDVVWGGAIVSSEALPLWEAEPMESGAERSPLTVRDVLEQHGGEVWYQKGGAGGARTGCFRFIVPRGEPGPVAERAGSLAPSRPEYYDFDLFGSGALAGQLNEARLATLSYTVFDTETTGLEPSAGDEIISIGAVRVVNGRLLRNEVFEQLVDPRRPLSRASVKVHGIDAAALEGQPTIAEVLPAFHRFCEDTVLVAHNAAFDMRFIDLKQAGSGVRFSQPVLDTLLLSAVAHPGLEDHRLESIAVRLGIDVMGRHTALGDALLAGEVFLRLLPFLAERGIVTLGQALAASRASYYARLQY